PAAELRHLGRRAGQAPRRSRRGHLQRVSRAPAPGGRPRQGRCVRDGPALPGAGGRIRGAARPARPHRGNGMIVATAGHIDHGKTLLVKTLTGVDTDRLPEEKARGISIDLGFAYLPLEGGGLIGFVDVPGHERFIRNMLAGVCGIDYALLVVAADDGVMPQTLEHLHILNLLGVREGIAVVTKIDRVAPERVQQVERDVAALLEGTVLAGSPVLPVSAVTGAGIAELRGKLAAAAQARAARNTAG